MDHPRATHGDSTPERGLTPDNVDDDAAIIPVTFGTGGRRGHRQPVDHDAIFDDLVIELTPRQRRLVEAAAWLLADDVYDAIEEGADISAGGSAAEVIHDSIMDDFPPCTWTQSTSWWREQARCFDDLAAEAQNGTDPEPRSTGEEMALHLILRYARALATDDPEICAELVDGIDAHASDDDWDRPLDFMFQDHDVLTLFDDDIELPVGAVNLAPEDWFTPFADTDARKPSRGFRR